MGGRDDMMEVIRYLAGGLFTLFGAFVIIATYITMFTKIKSGGGTSMVPLVGPLAFIGGIAITPCRSAIGCGWPS